MNDQERAALEKIDGLLGRYAAVLISVYETIEYLAESMEHTHDAVTMLIAENEAVEDETPQEALEDFDDYLDDAGTGMGMS